MPGTTQKRGVNILSHGAPLQAHCAATFSWFRASELCAFSVCIESPFALTHTRLTAAPSTRNTEKKSFFSSFFRSWIASENVNTLRLCGCREGISLMEKWWIFHRHNTLAENDYSRNIDTHTHTQPTRQKLNDFPSLGRSPFPFFLAACCLKVCLNSQFRLRFFTSLFTSMMRCISDFTLFFRGSEISFYGNESVAESLRHNLELHKSRKFLAVLQYGKLTVKVISRHKHKRQTSCENLLRRFRRH